MLRCKESADNADRLGSDHLGSDGEEICLQCRRPGFDPWGWEDTLEKGTATTPVFWRGEFHGLYSPWGGKESDMTEQLSFHFIST